MKNRQQQQQQQLALVYIMKLIFVATLLLTSISARVIDNYEELLTLPAIVHEDLIIRSCPTSLQLENLAQVDGDLIIENCSQLAEINLQNLDYVQGDLKLQKLTSLVILDLPKLNHVRSFELRILPILNLMTLNPNMMVEKNLIISDTSLTNIDQGEFSNVKDLDILSINNNRFLEVFKFKSIKKIAQQLAIHANAKEIEIDLPVLHSSRNITIRDTSAVSLPSLEFVQTSLELIENQFSSLDFSKLRYVGGTLGIINNLNLERVDLNNLTEISGGLMISHNDKLRKVNFLSNLKQIGGAIHFDGRFDDISFQNLKLVKGSAFIKSTSALLDCQKWINPIRGKSVVRGGKIECVNGKSLHGNQAIPVGNPILPEKVNHENKNPGNKGFKNAKTATEYNQAKPLMNSLIESENSSNKKRLSLLTNFLLMSSALFF